MDQRGEGDEPTQIEKALAEPEPEEQEEEEEGSGSSDRIRKITIELDDDAYERLKLISSCSGFKRSETVGAILMAVNFKEMVRNLVEQRLENF